MEDGLTGLKLLFLTTAVSQKILENKWKGEILLSGILGAYA